MGGGQEKESGAPVFGVELYRDLKEKGLLLSDFVDEQLEAIAQWKPEVAESGLALDVLFYHTTDQGTAETRTLEQVNAEYAHRQEVIEPLLKSVLRRTCSLQPEERMMKAKSSGHAIGA